MCMFLQKPPSFLLKFKSEETVSQKQIWHESGECPVGTVPIRRTLAKDILRAGSIDKYRTKKGGMSAVPKPSPATITSSSHEVILPYYLSLKENKVHGVYAHHTNCVLECGILVDWQFWCMNCQNIDHHEIKPIGCILTKVKMIVYFLGVYSSLGLMFVMLGDILRLCSGWCVTACNIIHARGFI